MNNKSLQKKFINNCVNQKEKLKFVLNLLIIYKKIICELYFNMKFSKKKFLLIYIIYKNIIVCNNNILITNIA